MHQHNRFHKNRDYPDTIEHNIGHHENRGKHGYYKYKSIRYIKPARSLLAKTILYLFICGACIFIFLYVHNFKFDTQYTVFDSAETDENLAEKGYNLDILKIESDIDRPFQIGCREIDTSQPRADAVLVMLARNEDLAGVIKSMKSIERHFNQWFNYPWVFLNDNLFDENFKVEVAKFTDSKVEFGTVPREHWEFPEELKKSFIDESINLQGDRGIFYGNMKSYHKMCRYFSGFFFKHELVKQHKWYWRVEPDVEFFCDLTYDPFIEMERNNKRYGFTVIITELYYTIPNLFREVKSFIKKNKLQVGTAWPLILWDTIKLKGDNLDRFYEADTKSDVLRTIERNEAIKVLLEQQGMKEEDLLSNPLVDEIINDAYDLPTLYEDRIDHEDYNLCHFWSNFEIARTDLFNSPLYNKFFEHLDASGGFFRERWGDAAVHTFGVAMMLDLNEIHYFRDIGYKHTDIAHCPHNSRQNQLAYQPSSSSSSKPWLKKSFWESPNRPNTNGVGCRCQCPRRHKEIEIGSSDCPKIWANAIRSNRIPLVDTQFYEQKIRSKLQRFLRDGGKVGQSNIADTL